MSEAKPSGSIIFPFSVLAQKYCVGKGLEVQDIDGKVGNVFTKVIRKKDSQYLPTEVGQK
jgi:hypothetical protein